MCIEGQLYPGTFFSATGTYDEIMWKILQRKAGEKQHYTRNVSHDINLLDN
jgi:hypothetical protein